MPFYPPASAASTGSPVRCACPPCRLGNAAAHPARVPRYPSDMTGAEWDQLLPELPVPAWLAGKGGRPEEYCWRQMTDAVRYLTDNGIKWRAVPADFPRWDAVYAFFCRWRWAGFTAGVHGRLREKVRKREGRNAGPTASVIDSQSLRAAETAGKDTRGYDAGKRVAGRKRHIAVDTIGMLLVVLVTSASVQDRDGARPLLGALRKAFTTVSLAWADGGYAGQLVAWAKEKLRLTVQIVKRSDDAKGFVVLPRRWVVERTLSWICRRRRCVRDYERLPEHHAAMVQWAMIIVMTRRLARSAPT